MILYQHLDVNQAGHLTIGGLDTVELAKEFGTPAYIIDEDAIRSQCRMYKEAMTQFFGVGSIPLFASKALCFAGMYKIAAEEGLGVDCVSGGELYTAKIADFPASRIYFHGNNKTEAEITQALSMGVGTIVVDNADELAAVSDAAQKRGRVQRILLRVTPGIDPHTHKAITTGVVDSKFGSPISTGQAMRIVKAALETSGVELAGLHCHIGSQIFKEQPFFDTADIMTKFISDIYTETGYEIRELNLGGGIGVPYTQDQFTPDYSGIISKVASHINQKCEEYDIDTPRVTLEPGRSLVAAAGITLYTVGSVKDIPGYRKYVAIDGGMTDNPRYALYGAEYTALIANKANQEKTVRATIAGRSCESGDLIGEDIALQNAERGDILAVLTTGAYNYSMASNYNRVPRPPVIAVSNGQTFIRVRRETYEDIVRLDVTDQI